MTDAQPRQRFGRAGRRRRGMEELVVAAQAPRNRSTNAESYVGPIVSSRQLMSAIDESDLPKLKLGPYGLPAGLQGAGPRSARRFADPRSITRRRRSARPS